MVAAKQIASTLSSHDQGPFTSPKS
eukprot:SAG11_NODE_30798_length_297_cov_1.252525_1_plen_24_part_01